MSEQMFLERISQLSEAKRRVLALRLQALGVSEPDGTPPQAEARLAAFVIPEEGRALDPEALRAALAGRLPGYMAPASYVELDELPRTPNGKVDRRALQRMALETGPGSQKGSEEMDKPAVQSPGTEAPAFADPLEEEIAGLWAELLGMAPGDIRRDDHFFELGGHSLLVTRLAARLRAHLAAQGAEIELPVGLFFQHPTVAGQAAQVRGLQLDALEGMDREVFEL